MATRWRAHARAKRGVHQQPRIQDVAHASVFNQATGDCDVRRRRWVDECFLQAMGAAHGTAWDVPTRSWRTLGISREAVVGLSPLLLPGPARRPSFSSSLLLAVLTKPVAGLKMVFGLLAGSHTCAGVAEKIEQARTGLRALGAMLMTAGLPGPELR